MGEVSTGHEFVPGAEDFGLEEFRGVVGGEGLVDFEGGDLCGDCSMWLDLEVVRVLHVYVLCGPQPVMSPPTSCALVDRPRHRVASSKP